MTIRIRYDPDIALLGEVAGDIGKGQAAIRNRDRRDQLLREFLVRRDQLQAQMDAYANQERNRLFEAENQYANRADQGYRFDVEQQRLREAQAQAGEQFGIEQQRLQQGQQAEQERLYAAQAQAGQQFGVQESRLREAQTQAGEQFGIEQQRLRDDSQRIFRQHKAEQERLTADSEQRGNLALLGIQQRDEAARLNADTRREYYLAQIQQREQAKQEQEQRLRQEAAVKFNAEWKLSDQQQADLKKKQDTAYTIQQQVNSGQLSPGQGQLAMQQLEQQMPESMFEPQLIPKEKPPIAEQFQAQTFQEEDGSVWTLDNNQVFRLEKSPPKPEQTQQISLPDAVKAAKEYLGPPQDYLETIPYNVALSSLVTDFMAGRIPGQDQGQPEPTAEPGAGTGQEQPGISPEMEAAIAQATQALRQAKQTGDPAAIEQAKAALVKLLQQAGV